MNDKIKSGIYKITNKVNGKVYVGSAVSLQCRWNGHKRALSRGKHHSRKLQRAWDKYGADAFEFSILEHVIDTTALFGRAHFKSVLHEREQYWMDMLNAVGENGYNHAVTAGSLLGMKFGPPSQEVRDKISAAQIGKVISAETRAKLAAANIGKKASLEARAKMSVVQTGRKHSAESIEKMRAWQKGIPKQPLSPETRAKISAVQKGRVKSETERANISAAQKNKAPPSEETRKRISLAAKARKPPSAETRAKLSAAGIGRMPSEETRKSLSEAAKNRSPEHLAKIADANRRKTIPEEQRRQIAATLTGRKATDAAREKMSEFQSKRERKLNMAKAEEIRSLYAAGGVTKDIIGAMYDIHPRTVDLIINRKKWVDGKSNPRKGAA